MVGSTTELKPAGWRVTATTIYCDLVGDFVTILVHKDWSANCVWYNRYKREVADRKIDKKLKVKAEKCTGPECPHVIGYRDKLIKEEFGNGS